MKNLTAFLLITAFSLNVLAFETTAKNDPSVLLKTPPAPRFTDAERQAELARRRSEVARKMQPSSVLLMFSAEPRNYAGDVDFLFRQENYLYYLTNLKQKNASLLLVKTADGQVQEFLFLPKRNPANETWNGRMYSRQDATRISGLKTIIDASELTAFITALGKKESFTSKESVSIAPAAQTVYLLLPSNPGDRDGMAEFKREQDFSKTLAGYKIENVRPVFDELRLVKSPFEQKLLQHAIDITMEAHSRAMATARNVKWEYETQAEIEYTFRRRNADYWGYPSIVGCGPNATTLHYEESQGQVRPGDLLLMDVGAEYDHYTADVTRTFPISGKFTKEQAEIYQIVFDAQEAAAKAIKPGATFEDASQAASNVIKQGLARLGLITAPDATIQGFPQYRLWYMHGWGHWLGMNVHDVGDYDTPFKPGMVMTNEPGIYIRGDALDYLPKTPEAEAFIAKVKPVFERYKNIGVRIEDDMLVTANGVEWMTKKLPRTITDVEAFMARAFREMPQTAVRKNSKPAAFLTAGENVFLPSYRFHQLNSRNAFPQGRTVRSGWIWTGERAAHSGSQHGSAHSHDGD